MSIQSNEFGRVALTDSDARKFQAQATYDRAKAAAKTNVSKGVALSRDLKKSGSIKLKLKQVFRLAAFDAIDIEIRQIEPGDRLTGLSHGDEKFAPLKTFLQRHAATQQRQSLSRTYAAFNTAENDRIAGYITVVCGEVVTGDGDAALVDDEGLGYLYKQYPAVKIARLAVDQRVRGRGIGEALVNLCLGVTTEFIAPNVGCRFVMVDSKQEAIAFYDRLGFTMLDTPANRDREEPVMFIDLSKLQDRL